MKFEFISFGNNNRMISRFDGSRKEEDRDRIK